MTNVILDCSCAATGQPARGTSPGGFGNRVGCIPPVSRGLDLPGVASRGSDLFPGVISRGSDLFSSFFANERGKRGRKQ